MCKKPRSSICISLADKQQCILIPGENTPQACYWSQQSCPSKKPTPCSIPLGREYSLLRARSILCFVRQLVAVQIVFWAAKHGSFSLLVFLCVLYSLFIKLDCQLPQDSIGGFVFCSASSNRSSFPQKLKVASRKQEFFDDQSKYLSGAPRLKKRRDHNVKVAFCGFLLVFVFAWKFITPTELKLCKTQTGSRHRAL